MKNKKEREGNVMFITFFTTNAKYAFMDGKKNNSSSAFKL